MKKGIKPDGLIPLKFCVYLSPDTEPERNTEQCPDYRNKGKTCSDFAVLSHKLWENNGVEPAGHCEDHKRDGCDFPAKECIKNSAYSSRYNKKPDCGHYVYADVGEKREKLLLRNYNSHKQH